MDCVCTHFFGRGDVCVRVNITKKKTIVQSITKTRTYRADIQNQNKITIYLGPWVREHGADVPSRKHARVAGGLEGRGHGDEPLVVEGEAYKMMDGCVGCWFMLCYVSLGRSMCFCFWGVGRF